MGNINNELSILFPKKSPALAEFIGIMLGDGHIYVSENKRAYQVRIIGHKKDDRDYLINHVNLLIKKLFGLTFNNSNKLNCLLLSKNGKKLVYVLKYYGLHSGNKVHNNVGIPSWVFDSKEYLKSYIRGLIDTDGCVCPITGRNYTYIWFKSGIPRLRYSFDKAMDLLGYRIAKWTGKKTAISDNVAYQIYIGSKEYIRKYYKEIGFNNSKHQQRFRLP